MDKPISVGDLVVVTKPANCGCTKNVGRIFLITKLKTNWTICSGCGDKDHTYQLLADGDADFSYPLHRIKRIPPIEELDDVKQDEEITA